MSTFICTDDSPTCGSVPASVGLPAVLRIPVPGENGLAVELYPRGYIPKGGSTSSIFIQDSSGKRHLRLDYGYNKVTGNIEWHWNQKGTAEALGITNHTAASGAGKKLGSAARYYRYAGRALVVVGAAVDAYSIVTASKPLRRSIQVISAWGAAAAGCKVVGAGGAYAGSFAPGAGNMVGALAGCAVGGFIGYFTGERVAGYAFDWAEGTIFVPLDETPQ